MKLLKPLFFIAFFIFCSQNAEAQCSADYTNLVSNSSMDGALGRASLATGWTSYNTTSPDLNSFSCPAVGCSNYVAVRTVSSSTDGGSWVGMTGTSTYFAGVQNTVSLVAGKTYTFTFEQANFGAEFNTYFISDDGKIELLIDEGTATPTTVIGDGGTLPLGTPWNQVSITYTPTISGVHTFAVRAKTLTGLTNGAYLSFDGFSVCEPNCSAGSAGPILIAN